MTKKEQREHAKLIVLRAIRKATPEQVQRCAYLDRKAASELRPILRAGWFEAYDTKGRLQSVYVPSKQDDA